MGLMSPMYNHLGRSKKPKKMKFKSADEKAAYLAAQESEYGIAKKRRTTAPVYEPLVAKTYVRETPHYPSLNSGMAVALKAPDKVYTGTKMIGIGTLHKSNAVPVFCDEEAVAMANMRR